MKAILLAAAGLLAATVATSAAPAAPGAVPAVPGGTTAVQWRGNGDTTVIRREGPYGERTIIRRHGDRGWHRGWRRGWREETGTVCRTVVQRRMNADGDMVVRRIRRCR